MSEGMSAILRPNRPSLKRRRAEALDSGGSTRRPGCGYQGCRWPTRENQRGGYERFCGKTHKDFYMLDLVDMFEHGGAGSSHVTELQHTAICKLSGCDLPVEVDSSTGCDFDFCRKEHYFEYREECTPQWARKGTLCKRRGCFHHVWVEETHKKIHDFCGEKCAALAYAAKGLSSLGPQNPWLLDSPKVDGNGPSSDEIRIGTSQRSAQKDLQVKLKKGRGYHTNMSEVVKENCLKILLNHPGDYSNADPSGKLCIGVNVMKSHPWNLVKDSEGGSSRFFLSWFDSAQSNEWSTLQDFAWKRTSRKNDKQNKRLLTTYFVYEYRGKSDTSNDHLGGHVPAYREFNAAAKAKQLEPGKASRWKMHEIVLSEAIVREIVGESGSTMRPRMWRIFQDKEKGLPVWPPLLNSGVTQAIKVIAEESNAVFSVGALPEVVFLGEDRVMSSISSNVSTGAELHSGGITLMESNSNETEERDVFANLQDDTPITSVSDSPVNLDDGLWNLDFDSNVHVGANMFSLTQPDGFDTFRNFPLGDDIMDSDTPSDRSFPIFQADPQ